MDPRVSAVVNQDSSLDRPVLEVFMFWGGPRVSGSWARWGGQTKVCCFFPFSNRTAAGKYGGLSPEKHASGTVKTCAACGSITALLDVLNERRWETWLKLLSVPAYIDGGWAPYNNSNSREAAWTPLWLGKESATGKQKAQLSSFKVRHDQHNTLATENSALKDEWMVPTPLRRWFILAATVPT